MVVRVVQNQVTDVLVSVSPFIHTKMVKKCSFSLWKLMEILIRLIHLYLHWEEMGA